ncbi:MAG: hypothetical protein V4666_09910 [Bacteroidota bacterium]
MEKKLELTISSKIIKNLIISIVLAVLIVFILNFIVSKGTRSPFFQAETFFGENIYGSYDKLGLALKALSKDIPAILILSSVLWIISIINHFVNFKIK